MADTTETAATIEQHDIELPNGVVVSGMGGDVDALREAFEERHEERTGETPEPEPEPEPTPDEPKPAAVAKTVETPKVDKRTRGQKRFDELTLKAEDAARRADAAEAKAKELEAKLAAAPVVEPKPPVPTREETQPIVTAGRPKPTEAEVGAKYQTYADFIEDLADWKAEQRISAAQKDLDARTTARIEAERASRSRTDRASEAMTRGRTVYPDFDAVLGTVNDILIPPDYQQAILSVESPEHVMYALAKDRTKLQTILKIQSGVQLGLALAKLVPSAAVASPASTAPVVRTTNAPAPVQPVGASARTTSPTSAELADHGDDFDSSGYRERRAKELGRRPVR
jgi:hypothetical protein